MLHDIAPPLVEMNPTREALFGLIQADDPLEEIELSEAMAELAEGLGEPPDNPAWPDLITALLVMLGDLPEDAVVARTAEGVSASANLDLSSGQCATTCLHINELESSIEISIVYDDGGSARHEMTAPGLLTSHFARRLK